MATTVHLPSRLMDALDRRAKAMGVSRNRLIVRAVEQAVHGTATWTPEFLDRLRDVDTETASAVDELLKDVKEARRSKKPQDL